MKKQKFWILVSTFLVFTMITTACNATTPTRSTTTVTGIIQTSNPVVVTTTTTTPPTTVSTSLATSTVSTEPTYGGTINICDSEVSTQRFDALGPTANRLSYAYEGLLAADWYVDRNVFDFGGIWYPYTATAGVLAQSWELTDPRTFTFHLRQGVHWQNVPPVNGREFVSNDVKRFFEAYMASTLTTKGNLTSVESVSTPDKYTVVFKLKADRTTDFFASFVGAASAVLYQCPDMWDAKGSNAYQNWHNACGTGPFMLTDFVDGASWTFTRNPDYWGYDKNYPKNQLPYAQVVRNLIISDPATQLAALRSGKVDLISPATFSSVTWDQVSSLANTNPELMKRAIVATPGLLAMNTKKAPFNDVRVRQAMNMAIDYEAICKGFYGGNAIVGYKNWPFHLSYGELAIKVEEWPQIVRDQYEYHPDQAQKLLADAGYPSGFTTTVEAIAGATMIPMLEIFQTYWAKIGVTVKINVDENAAYSVMKYGQTYPGMLSAGLVSVSNVQADPISMLTVWYVPGVLDYSAWKDDTYIKNLSDAQTIQDTSKRYAAYKDLARYVMENAVYVVAPAQQAYIYWQPWLKGYRGEVGLTYADKSFLKYLWVGPHK